MVTPQVSGIRSLLVANRGEIAIRVMRAAAELGIRTIAIYSQEDRFSLHRTKADEAYLVGRGKGPVDAYLDIEDVLRIAREAQADAIHPGYGFLSENPQFAEACERDGVIFVGPTPQIMRTLGNKVSARNAAASVGVPVMPATPALPPDPAAAQTLAREIGYPVMLKASWGGGGRGMRVIENDAQLAELLPVARREAQAAFGNDEVYLEKLVRRARHLEVQILGDRYGNLVHLFERDCTVQRRNQKVVERAPAVFLTDAQRTQLCEAGLKLGRAVNYLNAGTVEFLQDADTGEFYFIEVNPRIQVEHTVTECAVGIDIVKAQIRIAAGARIGTPESGVPPQHEIRMQAHALQCRVTTEDPENNFIPDYGRVTAYRSPAGFGIRLDAGTAYAGAIITRSYDSLLVKITAWAQTAEEASARMHRALWEFRIRGVVTNLRFLDQVITHPAFASGEYTTRFIDSTPELFRFPRKRDRATRMLTYLAETVVNGNAETKGRPRPARMGLARLPKVSLKADPPAGAKQKLDELGPEKFARWMLAERRVLLTDTTMRDAHQSLLATRMRTIDMAAIAPYYARMLPELLSVECWGGATFDVAMRFLKEDPWERLAQFREGMPNLLLQMLLRASNAVGYTNYPDNVVRYFVRQAAACGVDLFRVFDSLNWVENMRVAMDAVLETGRLCEAAICYTGNLSDPREKKYTLDYYVSLARELKAAGAHIIAIKDMAGLCRPAAARALVTAIKSETGLPLHFHTHDTSGIAAASVLAAAEAGCDAIDGAIDAMSGLTSQPNLGSIAEALRHGERDPGIDTAQLRRLSSYWEQVRRGYAAFESDIRSGASEVYVHGMPGGQYTNLREQARALGVDEARWPDVAQAYADVNDMLGDIIKVTPTSKVVGDMAILMVTSGLTRAQVEDPDTQIAFPESLVQLMRGDLGQPLGGFPQGQQKKVLKDIEPLTVRPGKVLPPIDLEATRAEVARKVGREITDYQLASYLMYPRVFLEYAKDRAAYGDVGRLPTPAFFYGMEPGQEISIDIERGKTLIVNYVAVSETHDDGTRTVFFELNGEPRAIRVADRSQVARRPPQRKAESGNTRHVGAPMPGSVATVAVTVGQKIARGDVVVTLEAMKMETAVRAEQDGQVAEVLARPGMQVDAKDLLVVIG
ncbi:MAG TPA: pyruvate carboxylase [Steroidobacteraceae bacterium]|nr:pyruvate carboxylase [Steroidobacteraceae bacterium]HNS27308.1 pyruvate carboxylase [Steroidobacteraceae bacterium]